MLAALRAFAKSWIAVLLIGLLVVSFAIWGVNDAFKARIGNNVIKAGEHEVSQVQFRQVWDNALKTISQQQGRMITTQEAVDGGLVQTILGDMSQGEALWELIRRAGVRPSDALLGRQLQSNRVFYDPITQRFDPETYKRVLSENNITPADFESSLRDEIAENHFVSGMTIGLRPPAIYSAALTAFLLESRSAGYFVVEPRMVPQVAPPTDAQLTAFMRENAAQLRRPETRTVSLVRFSAAALTPSMPVDEAAVQERWKLQQGKLSTPEKRSFVQIPVRSGPEAQAAAQRLAQGQDAAVVARALGVQPIVNTNVTRETLPDPAVAEAAFRLPNGQVAPVRGNFGAFVIKVTAITPGKTASFDEARPQLEQAVREAKAQERVYADVQKFDEASAGGAALQQAAQAVGAKVYTLGPMTAQGQDQFGRPVVGLNAAMLKQAFSLAQGAQSDVGDLGKGEYYAMRVDRVQPAALPTLAEVRPQLARVWTLRETVKRMQARADQLAERVRRGEALAAVAASVGAPVRRVDNVSRATIQQNQALGRNFLQALIGAKPREVFTAEAAQFGIAVARVDAIRSPDPRMTAALSGARQGQLMGQMFRETADLVKAYAREKLKPQVSPEKAYQAIGLSGDQAKAAGGAPARKAG
ncbi:MAG TPA: peptidyl-prolyl cis-trans isomerase [Caulobacteraceae bacterium]